MNDNDNDNDDVYVDDNNNVVDNNNDDNVNDVSSYQDNIIASVQRRTQTDINDDVYDDENNFNSVVGNEDNDDNDDGSRCIDDENVDTVNDVIQDQDNMQTNDDDVYVDDNDYVGDNNDDIDDYDGDINVDVNVNVNVANNDEVMHDQDMQSNDEESNGNDELYVDDNDTVVDDNDTTGVIVNDTTGVIVNDIDEEDEDYFDANDDLDNQDGNINNNTNEITLETLRDNMVSENTSKAYIGDITTFLHWTYHNEVGWLTNHGRECLSEVFSLNEGESERKHRMRQNKSVKLLLRASNTNHIVRLHCVSASRFMEYIMSLKNTRKPNAYLSKSSYGNKRSSLFHLFRMHNRTGFTDEFDAELAGLYKSFF
jgi:hypothetical protein